MKFGKLGLVLLVVFTSVGCDQVTKIAAREHLQGLGTQSFLGDTIRLVLVENHGAFLGMGSQLPAWVRTLIFVVLVGLFILAVSIWLFRTSPLSKTTIVACSFLIGGGIGNLIDRILFSGAVTDFLNVGIGSLRTGIFNVADLWIVGAIVVLIFSPEMRQGLKEPPPQPEQLPDT